MNALLLLAQSELWNKRVYGESQQIQEGHCFVAVYLEMKYFQSHFKHVNNITMYSGIVILSQTCCYIVVVFNLNML